MVDKKGPLSSKDGLTDHTPLGSRIGRVQVAVRPPDPVLVEKLQEGLKEISRSGPDLPGNSSLAVRSVDGFYFIRSLDALISSVQPEMVSVVNYDPARRTFILSGKGEVNDLCELFWYAFEAFTTDSILFHDRGSGGDLQAPDQMDERVSFNISRLQEWKVHRVMEEGSSVYWRGPALTDLFEFLRKRYG
jgi:hypothetical protein